MSVAPTILTPRLELRGHRADDLNACIQLWTDPEVTRYTSGRPLSRQEVWTRLLRHPGHWVLLGFGYWLVFQRETGQFVGELGLAQFRRDALQHSPEYELLPEAGWVLLPWAQGQGMAFEAMSAVLDWRDTHLKVQSVFCLIQPDNAPSLRLAARLSFTLTTEIGEGAARTALLVRD